MSNVERFFGAVKSGDAPTVVRMVGEDRALLEARDGSGLSPLLCAVFHRRNEVVELMRRRGVSLDVHEASALGDVAAVESHLADRPTLVNAYGPDGSTPLHLACYFGHPTTVDLLLERGADVHRWSENALRNQPLHAALAGSRDRRIVDALLDHGADPGSAAAGGYTPLHLAAARGDAELCEKLGRRAAGAVLTDDGRSAADLAQEYGHPQLADRLRIAGGDAGASGKPPRPSAPRSSD